MITVKKENRVLTILEAEKESYLLQGYDVINEKTGKVEEVATGGRTYTAAEYAALKAELDQLKSEKAGAKNGKGKGTDKETANDQ